MRQAQRHEAAYLQALLGGLAEAGQIPPGEGIPDQAADHAAHRTAESGGMVGDVFEDDAQRAAGHPADDAGDDLRQHLHSRRLDEVAGQAAANGAGDGLHDDRNDSFHWCLVPQDAAAALPRVPEKKSIFPPCPPESWSGPPPRA